MPLTPVAGAKLYIGPKNNTADSESDYEALTFVQVEQVQSIGDFGDEKSIIREETIDDPRVLKAEGTADGGAVAVTYLYKNGATGQAALLAARDGVGEYAIKVELKDQITPSTGNPTTYYFRAIVAGARVQLGGPNSGVKRAVSLEVTSAEIEIAAT